MEMAAAMGFKPNLMRKPKASAPNNPPTLKSPWSDDMIGLPELFWTCTPWLFMATSTVPTAQPKINRVMAITGMDEMRSRKGRQMAMTMAEIIMIIRVP